MDYSLLCWKILSRSDAILVGVIIPRCGSNDIHRAFVRRCHRGLRLHPTRAKAEAEPAAVKAQPHVQPDVGVVAQIGPADRAAP